MPKRRGMTFGAEGEQAIWNLEQAYWRYVETNNLASYRNLWHQEFVGWPLLNAAPVRKDVVTDWITSQTDQGLRFELVELTPAAIQMHRDLAVVYYWVSCKWVDKTGAGAAHKIRATHTWLKNGKDWQIVGGMSMTEGADGQER